MINNFNYIINNLKKTKFTLNSIYFFKKLTILWYTKNIVCFWEKKFMAIKKAKFGVP